jgi:hypothetical protein
MEAINPTILKTTIEAIPVLTKENFSSWRTRITALFKLGGVKDQMLDGEPALDNNDNTILCAILLAKLSPTAHSNVVTTANEDTDQLLWKSIMKCFILSEPSNRARVYIQFANIMFDASNIEKLVTEVKSSLNKMEDVRISLPKDILTYELLRRLPGSFDTIKQNITHSKNGEDIRPDVLLDHLKIHMNKSKVSAATQGKSVSATMLTAKEKKCCPGYHYPQATHSKEQCWNLYPKKKEAHLKKDQEANVSILSTFSCHQPSLFVLDSGSTSHMVSDKNMFLSLDEDKQGMIKMSCGTNTLQTKERVSFP